MKKFLPELLRCIGGKEIKTAEEWEEFRRPELLRLFEEWVYGRCPVEKPEDLTFSLLSEEKNAVKGLAVCRKAELRFAGYSFPVRLYLPKNRETPLPAFVYPMLQGQSEKYDLETETNPLILPLEEIMDRGYAVAVYEVKDVDPDYDDQFQNGVHGAFPMERQGDSWGTIAAWAWAGSRIFDYLETQPEIDTSRVAIAGHSRGGKTALWCGARDARFKLVISNDSGCTGAAVSRGKKGETVALINRQFPHWFCRNYKKYNDREEFLPVDQHMLLSLIAPRYLYVASASRDDWADPEAELYSARLAGETYALYQKPGLALEGAPKENTGYQEGCIAYHRRTGEHQITPFDWRLYMDYADKNL